METKLLNGMSPDDWAAFAVNDLAYVKLVREDGVSAFAIHAADGTPLAVLGDRDVAFAAVRQHGLEPVSVH
jgi:hypothetical protein